MAFFDTDAETIVKRVWDNLHGSRPQERPYPFRLIAAIDDSQTTLTESTEIETADQISYGDILEVEESGEQLLVVGTTATTLTVERGWNRTTAAATAGAGIAFKNPRFTYKHIYDTAVRILRELPGHGVFKYNTDAITLTQGDYTYDFSPTPEVESVLFATWTDTDGSGTEYDIPVPLTVTANDLVGASNVRVRLERSSINDGDTVDVYFRSPFEDDFSGLTNEVTELVVLGTTGQMLASSMAARTFDPGRHSDRTIQPGQGGRDGAWYLGEFMRAAKREAARQRVFERDRRGSLKAFRARSFRAG